MKRIRNLICLAALLVLCMGTTVFAANNSFGDAKTIPTNGTNVTFQISQSDATYYGKLNVSSTGLLSISAKRTYSGSITFKLVASDQSSVVKEYQMKADTKSGSFSEYVEKGTYYLVITREDGDGSLTISARATAVAGDKEDNGSIEKAISLSLNSTKQGLITWNDKYDTYKFSMSNPGILTVDMTKYFNYELIFGVKDSNGISVDAGTLSASKDKGRLILYLPKGTFYLTIQPGKNATGKYTIKTSVKNVSSDPEPNDTMQTACTWNMSGSGTTTNGFISYGDKADYYKVTLSKAGKITCKISKGFVGDCSYTVLLPDDMTTILSGNIEGKGTAEKKVSESFTTYLEAGTYYLRVKPREGSLTSYGIYTMNTRFSTVTNDSKANNDPRNATRLAVNGCYANGCLTWQDTSDHYAFRTEKDGKIELNVKKNFSTVMDYEILNDATLTALETGSFTGKAGVYTVTKELPAGSYIIRIKKHASDEGTYSLKVADKAPGTPTIKKVTVKSTKVTGTAMPNTSVTIQAGSKTYTATSNASGTYTVKIAKQKKGTVIKAYAKNSLGTSAAKSIKVTAK